MTTGVPAQARPALPVSRARTAADGQVLPVYDRALPSRVGIHPAVLAALRASPPRPSTTRIAIEPSMRCMPGPTWWTAIAWIWLSRRNRATRA